MVLNLFPVRVPIGRVDQSGQVIMTPEFARALASLLERVGGVESPSLTTVINNLGDVTNIVTSIENDESFSNKIPDENQSLESFDHFSSAPMQDPQQQIDFSQIGNDQSQQISDLQILLEQSKTVVSDITEMIKTIEDFSIQNAFVAMPFLPVPLAPDAIDLITVIALANTLKQALKSNGIGS